MEPQQLPFVDAYEQRIPAPPGEAWQALEKVLRRQLGGAPPALLVKAWGLKPNEHRGGWSNGIAIGSTVPGFEVSELLPGEHLVLAGRHRFSRYAAVFDLSESDGGTRLRVETWAAFPGLAGRAYRAIVIGSRMHTLVARGLLRRVAEQVRPI